MKILFELYEKHFLLKSLFIKMKDLQAPSVTTETKKFSKQISKLYIKFLKDKSKETEKDIKTL